MTTSHTVYNEEYGELNAKDGKDSSCARSNEMNGTMKTETVTDDGLPDSEQNTLKNDLTETHEKDDVETDKTNVTVDAVTIDLEKVTLTDDLEARDDLETCVEGLKNVTVSDNKEINDKKDDETNTKAETVKETKSREKIPVEDDDQEEEDIEDPNEKTKETTKGTGFCKRGPIHPSAPTSFTCPDTNHRFYWQDADYLSPAPILEVQYTKPAERRIGEKSSAHSSIAAPDKFKRLEPRGPPVENIDLSEYTSVLYRETQQPHTRWVNDSTITDFSLGEHKKEEHDSLKEILDLVNEIDTQNDQNADPVNSCMHQPSSLQQATNLENTYHSSQSHVANPTNHMTSPHDHVAFHPVIDPTGYMTSPNHMTSQGSLMTNPARHMVSPSKHFTSPPNHMTSPANPLTQQSPPQKVPGGSFHAPSPSDSGMGQSPLYHPTPSPLPLSPQDVRSPCSPDSGLDEVGDVLDIIERDSHNDAINKIKQSLIESVKLQGLDAPVKEEPAACAAKAMSPNQPNTSSPHHKVNSPHHMTISPPPDQSERSNQGLPHRMGSTAGNCVNQQPPYKPAANNSIPTTLMNLSGEIPLPDQSAPPANQDSPNREPIKYEPPSPKQQQQVYPQMHQQVHQPVIPQVSQQAKQQINQPMNQMFHQQNQQFHQQQQMQQQMNQQMQQQLNQQRNQQLNQQMQQQLNQQRNQQISQQMNPQVNQQINPPCTTFNHPQTLASPSQNGQLPPTTYTLMAPHPNQQAVVKVNCIPATSAVIVSSTPGVNMKTGKQVMVIEFPHPSIPTTVAEMAQPNAKKLPRLLPKGETNPLASIQDQMTSEPTSRGQSGKSNPRPKCTPTRKKPVSEATLRARAYLTISKLDHQQLLFFDKDGDSLLHLTMVRDDALFQVEALIDRMVREKLLQQVINHKNKLWQTPLYLAVRTNKPLLVKMLLNHHADPNIEARLQRQHAGQEQNTMTPLHYAAQMGDTLEEITLLLLQRVNATHSPALLVNKTNFMGQTALHLAINGHGRRSQSHQVVDSRRTIRHLLLCGASLAQGDHNNGRTPFHHLVSKGDSDLLEHVLGVLGDLPPALQQANGNPVNAQTFDGQTPLHLAVQLKLDDVTEHVRFVTSLLNAGADVTVRNSNNRTAKDVIYQKRPQILDILKGSSSPRAQTVQ